MLTRIKRNCQVIIETKKERKPLTLLEKPITTIDNPLFCPYQTNLINDDSKVSVIEKGRQIGFTWLMAFKAVLTCASNERDFVYTSYNLISARDFMRSCAKWCKIFNLTYSLYEEECVSKNDTNIFEITFLNLRKIIAISGDATNLRGKSGAIILIDEVAYKEQSLSEIIAASMATLIHGGRVIIGSTHAGSDSDFNKLIQEIKNGKLPYRHHKITFRDAINDGLFKRICANNRQDWTQEKQDLWVKEIYDNYGVRASEELDAQPTDYSQSGKIFNSGMFREVDAGGFQSWDKIHFRYHDLAASSDPNDLSSSACYSASVRLTYISSIDKLVITDWTAEKVAPLEGDEMILNLAVNDGLEARQIIEIEPGSSGIKYVEYMKDKLADRGLFYVYGYKPNTSKIKRAIPAANALIRGDLLIDSELHDKQDFISLVSRFSAKSQPLVTDLADCLSGAYLYYKEEFSIPFS